MPVRRLARFRTHVASIILVVSGAVACSAPATDTDDAAADVTVSGDSLDVNDVSILFPLGPDGLPRPNITVGEATGASGPLFGPGTFKSLTEFAQSGSEGFKNPDTETNAEIVGQKPHVHIEDGALDQKNWQIVAMRFDPCAPGALGLGFSDPKCVVEMRLVAQPFVNGQVQDVAAHLVYNLGFLLTNPSLVGQMVKELQAIKTRSSVATTGQPLGVHPGLAAEASSGANDLGALVATFIKTYAAKSTDISLLGKVFSPARIVAFVVKDGDYTTPSDAPEWYFMGGNVAKDTWTPTEVTPVGKGVMFEKLSFKQKQGDDGAFAPIVNDQPAAVAGHLLPTPLTSTPTIEPLFGASTDAQRVETIEDQSKSSVQVVDCVSCHSSTSRTIALDLPPPARQKAPAGVTAVVRRENLQGGVANVRNFGYFAGKPTVSMRTLNETAAVADYVGRKFFQSGAGPSKVVVDDKLWTCCMNGGGDGCDGTVCATTDLPRRKVALEANGHGGDPCSPDASNQDIDTRTTVDVSSDGQTATLHGNNAACLTLSMNGNFFSDEVDIQCSELDLCTVALKKPGPISGDSARRLRNTLYLSETGGGFTAQDTSHQVGISCDQDCSITIK